MNAQRHHLIYLKPNATFRFASYQGNRILIEEQIKSWLTLERPLIYTKQLVDQASIHLGLTLLHHNKKHRIGLQVELQCVKKTQPLPQLIKLHEFFLLKYGIEGLESILRLSPIQNIGVYGSFLFHYLSNLPFVTAQSDLDILIQYEQFSLDDLHQLMALLAHKFCRNMDGEVRFPLFGDISIKELIDVSAKKLICKSRDNVFLLSRFELYECYPLL